MYKEIFPSIETVLNMEPEELAPFVLKHLKAIGKINRYNYTLGNNEEIRVYAGEYLQEFKERLMEAFVWLEREMFLAPTPGQTDDWRFITRKGEKALQGEDFTTYAKDSLLPSKNLHPIFVKRVKPLFLRGDYDTAIFQSFKIIEVEIRKRGGYTSSDYGIDLVRKAFHPEKGALANKYSGQASKQAMSDLFAGAIGLFKNPLSHRFIEDIPPEDAANIIGFANFLLTILGS